MHCIALILFLASNQTADEVATKNFWINFNDIIHKFNKTVNSNPSKASVEIKETIAKIRCLPTKNVDMLVLNYSERRVTLAVEYADFIDSLKIPEDIQFYKTEFPIKSQRDKFRDKQKYYDRLQERYKDMDSEQKVLIAYLDEKYKIKSN